MRFFLILRLALKGVLTNKVRSFLTVLGIVIGIAAVIALLALGEGAQLAVSKSISSLGSNLIAVLPGSQVRTPPGANTDAELSQRDYNYLNNKTRFPNITNVSPYVTSYAEVVAGSEKNFSNIKGVNFNFADIQELILDEGAFLSENDISGNSNNVVLGSDLAGKLFPKLEPSEIIGQSVSIKGQSFRIKGLLTARAATGFNNLNEDIYMAYSSLNSKILNQSNFSIIYLQVAETKLIDSVVLQVQEKLANYRGKLEEDRDFTVFTSEDILQTASQVTGIFTTLLSSIAAISLLVGGIGISNIMLVSVTERTKEIGLRKALGARQSDILQQFLLEAVTLTLIGGIVGIVLGLSLALGIGAATGIEARVSLAVIVLATSISALVGILFGFYPAYKAARLDPIVALRYE